MSTPDSGTVEEAFESARDAFARLNRQISGTDAVDEGQSPTDHD